MSTNNSQRCEDSGLAGLLPAGTVVPGGARAAEARGDAVVAVNTAEHDRRAAVGLGAVTNLALLDRLLCLPLGQWVRRVDLTDRERVELRRAPDGVVEVSDTGLRRVFAPAAAVPLVIVAAGSWRSGLRRTAAFAGYASRVLVLHGRHRQLGSKLWEADFFGVGVWRATATGVEQLVAPEPWRQMYVKPAGWAFRERAYEQWLRHQGLTPHPPGSLW